MLWNMGMFIAPGIWLDRAITGKQEDQDAAAEQSGKVLPDMVQADAWSKGEWEYALTRNISGCRRLRWPPVRLAS